MCIRDSSCGVIISEADVSYATAEDAQEVVDKLKKGDVTKLWLHGAAVDHENSPSLNEEACGALAAAMGPNKIVSLDLSDNRISGFATLLAALTTSGCLEEILLGNTNLEPGAHTALQALFQSCDKLKKIDMPDCACGPEEGSGLLQALTGSSKLEDVNFAYNDLDERSLEHLRAIVNKGGLKSLILTGNDDLIELEEFEQFQAECLNTNVKLTYESDEEESEEDE
eukprot:TRINITY_DN9075_c0_g2_i1.p1 TRINITY_DN9075_c0_g2~~TRINITY_DN9075_c0_g2_i1.p1  ORF type:complete len:226 (-),score=66.71 TRINITY_DN9075_c0_g2_i1:82-759(-)